MYKDQIDLLFSIHALSNGKIISTIIHNSLSCINIKLDSTNYHIWSKILEIHIDDKEKKILYHR